MNHDDPEPDLPDYLNPRAGASQRPSPPKSPKSPEQTEPALEDDHTRVLPAVPRDDDTRVMSSVPPLRREEPLPARFDPRGAGPEQAPTPRVARRSPRPTEPSQGPPARTPRVRKRRLGRILLSLLLVIVLAALALGVYLDFSLNREDTLADYEGRPADTPGTTWLLVGSDSREDLTAEQQAELATGDAAGKRTDTIMLLHIPDSDAPPTLVSLPRDTLVELPDQGQQKLNAAFSFGGGQLLVRTVEAKTGVRIDRYAEIGFGGFAGVVDSIGGVEMCIDEPMNDPKAGLDLQAGCQTLNGAQALGYVRTRASARADLDRIERQRKFLSALLSKASSPGTLLNPFTSVPLAFSATGTLIVDDGCHLWHLASMGLAMGADNLVTTTVPIAGTPTIDGVGSVVEWDDDAATAFFDAIRNDVAIPQELLTTG